MVNGKQIKKHMKLMCEPAEEMVVPWNYLKTTL